MQAKDFGSTSLVAFASTESILNEHFFVFAKERLQRGRSGRFSRDVVFSRG